MFTLPQNGEAGGVPSGTENYYSFDYANIHFVCLDSSSSDRDVGSPMLTWLESDLSSTTQEWIIAEVEIPRPPITWKPGKKPLPFRMLTPGIEARPLVTLNGAGRSRLPPTAS